MIVVTHEMAFARDIADHVLFMDAGTIAEQGPADEVLVRPGQSADPGLPQPAFITRGCCTPPADRSARAHSRVRLSARAWRSASSIGSGSGSGMTWPASDDAPLTTPVPDL